MSDLPTIQVDGTLDIETSRWDEFILAGVYLRGSGFQTFTWERESDYIDHLLNFEGTLWSHNGGKFDLLHVIEHFRRRRLQGVRVYASGQRVTSLVWNNLILRDSAALAPMNLKQFALIGDYQKTDTGLECRCGKACGGFCRVNRQMSTEEIGELTEYNRYDCLALFSALDKLSALAHQNQIALAGTVGQSAWQTVKHTLGIPDANWKNRRGHPSAYYNAVRKGYYGGRTQVFRPRAPHGYRYDLNSAYPAALASLALPEGRGNESWGPAAGKAFRAHKPGIYEATVRVPEGMFIPPLPYRTSERVSYPVGKIYGTWTRDELVYAESIGVMLEKVTAGIVWASEAPLFRPFCEHVWKLRDEAGPKSAIGTWYKWLANSLTGKLAQNPDVTEIELGPKVVKFCPADARCTAADGTLFCSQSRGCCEHHCYGTCGTHFPLDRNDYVFARQTYRLPSCGHIHWAAALTAHARIELHRQLTDDGQEGRTALYCDTDSCYSSTPRRRNLSEHRLGSWKYEGELEDWIALAPKTYAFKKPGSIELHARSKGIPNAGQNWLALSDGAPILIDRGVMSFRSALRAANADGGSIFRRKSFSRAMRLDGIHYGDRVLGSDGLTLPQPVPFSG